MDNASYYLGINIGGTGCSITLGTSSGQILRRTAWPTAEAHDPDQAIARICTEAASLQADTPALAAGVAIGGPLDTASGTVLAPPNLPTWTEVRLRDQLETRLGIPVSVAHDAAACALAEYCWGGWQEGTLVYLTCGTGFGAGIVQNGSILRSSNGLHPEIGHWQLLEEGPAAFGKVGSAEAFCSAKGLSRIAHWLFPNRWQTEPDPAEVSALAFNGDSQALEVLDRHANLTGKVCAMIAEFLCPDCIILGSLATHLGDPWTSRVQTAFAQQALPRIAERVQVAGNALGDRLQDLSALVVAQTNNF